MGPPFSAASVTQCAAACTCFIPCSDFGISFNSISGRINQPEQHLFAVPAEDLFDALAPVLRVKLVIEEFAGAWRSAQNVVVDAKDIRRPSKLVG
jgi:hypothetical protein